MFCWKWTQRSVLLLLLLTLDLDAVRPDGIGRDPIVSLAVVYAGVVSSDVRQVQHRTLN